MAPYLSLRIRRMLPAVSWGPGALLHSINIRVSKPWVSMTRPSSKKGQCCLGPDLWPPGSLWPIWPVLGFVHPQGQRHLWSDLQRGLPEGSMCCWQVPLALLAGSDHPNGPIFCLVPSKVVTSEDRPQNDICQLPCCGWDPQLNHLPLRPPPAPPLGPWAGRTCPYPLSPVPQGCPHLWSISLGPGGAVEGSRVPSGSEVAQA